MNPNEKTEPHRQTSERRVSAKRTDSFLRPQAQLPIANVIDDAEEISDIARAFSSIEGNAGDDEAEAASLQPSEIFDKIPARRHWGRKLAARWAARMHWLSLVTFSLAIVIAVCVMDKYDCKLPFKVGNIPHWALFSIPSFVLFIFMAVEFLHFLLDLTLSRLFKKSNWVVRLVVMAVMKRFKLALSFFLIDLLIIDVLLRWNGGVPSDDLWLAISICRAVYILSLAICLRNILLEFARYRVSRHLFEQAVSDMSFAKDMLVLLCVLNENDERQAIRQKWAENKRRNEFEMQMKRSAISTLQLPLKVVETGAGNFWTYSPHTMIEISSAQQMRLVAAGLRDVVFQSSAKLSFARIRTMLGASDDEIERCLETLFKRADGDYSPITAEEFFVCVQTLYTDRADLHHKVESFLNAADIAKTITNAFFFVVCVLLLVWSFGFPMTTMVLALPAILPSIAFAISQSVTDLVESVVFVTIRRPFGIGDRVAIDGQEYTVVRISMMTTDLVGLDHKLVTMSNSALSKTPIFNHRRAGPAVIQFQAKVAYTTEPEKLEMVKKAMKKYVQESPDSWKPDLAMLVSGLEDGGSLLLKFKFYHRLVWHESVLPGAKTDIINHLRQTMNELGIADSEPAAWINVDATGKPI